MSEEEIARVCFSATDPQLDGLESGDGTRFAISENPRNASLTIPIGPGPMEPLDGPFELPMYTEPRKYIAGSLPWGNRLAKGQGENPCATLVRIRQYQV